jgi:NitT/TauT family transport system ATP-binding protein
MNHPGIELQKISKSFNGHPVIENLDLHIDYGQFVTLLGASGCGKTTLLHLTAGIQLPDAGEIRHHEMRPVRMMFQEYGLFPWHDCLHNVLLGMNRMSLPPNEKIARAGEWLKTVGLADHRHKYPKELSGGMKQRVALAQVLATESPVILMDEPFGALDSLMRENLQNLVIDIWQKLEKTVVFVTHNVREAAFLGNRVIMLGDRGRVLLDRPSPVTDNRIDTAVIELEREIRGIIKNQEEKAS